MSLINQLLDEQRFYILDSELKGLDGQYHLFENRQLVRLRIHPLPNDKISVSNEVDTITLSDGDSFCTDRYGKVLKHIAGPKRHKDPFRALIAETTIGQKVFEGYNDEEKIFLSSDEFAIVHNSRSSYSRDKFVYGQNEKIYCIGTIITVYKKDGDGIHRIIIRSNAGGYDLHWFKNIIEQRSYWRYESGAFRKAHELIQQFKDEKDRLWIEKVLAEEAEAKANQKEIFKKIVSEAGTRSVMIENKKFIASNGNIYQNVISGKTLKTYEKLCELGFAGKIAAALTST